MVVEAEAVAVEAAEGCGAREAVGRPCETTERYDSLGTLARSTTSVVL